MHQICAQALLEQVDGSGDDGNSLIKFVSQVLILKACNCLNDVHADRVWRPLPLNNCRSLQSSPALQATCVGSASTKLQVLTPQISSSQPLRLTEHTQAAQLQQSHSSTASSGVTGCHQPKPPLCYLCTRPRQHVCSAASIAAAMHSDLITMFLGIYRCRLTIPLAALSNS